MSKNLDSGVITTDILIVGTGPSAVAAALTAINHGLSVALLEWKPRMQRFVHVALQSFHPEVGEVLRQLGAASALQHSLAATFRTVSIRGEEYEFSPAAGSYAFHVNRAIFDQRMLALALERGARLVHSDSLEPISSAGRFLGLRLEGDTEVRARFTLDGTGRTRVLTTQMRIRQQFYTPKLVVQTGVIRHPEPEWAGDKTTFQPYPRGWQWTTPCLDGAMTWTALFTPEDRWNPALLALRSRSEPGTIRSADASWRISRPLAMPGLMLIGDAAGHLDPAWGRGVLNALRSGIRAVTAIRNIISEPSMEGWHEADYDQWFVNEFEEGVELLSHAYLVKNINLTIRADFSR